MENYKLLSDPQVYLYMVLLFLVISPLIYFSSENTRPRRWRISQSIIGSLLVVFAYFLMILGLAFK